MTTKCTTDNPLTEAIIADTIYKFAGWLATREQRLVISASDDAVPVAEAVVEYLNELRGETRDPV